MSIKSILLFSLFFFLSFWQLHAQEYTIDVQQIGVEEGLLHRKVSTVFEDNNGLIWIGNDQGLQRYDGYEFKSWTKNDRTNLIYHIKTIGQDDDGWLWLFNGDELQFVFFHPETEEILTVEERFGNDFLLHVDYNQKGNWEGVAYHFPSNSQGQLLFTTTDGLLISYDKKQGFQSKKIENGISCKIQLIDDQDHLWVTVLGKGIYRLNLEGEILDFYPIEEGEIAGNFSQRNGEIYFISYHLDFPSQWVFNKIDSNGIIKNLPGIPQGAMIDNFYWAKNKDLGWEIFDSFENAPIHTIKKSDTNLSLFENVSPYGDSKGRVWMFGQYGLNKVEIRPSKFRKHFSFESKKDKPIKNSTRGIWVDQENIFANFERSHFVQIDKNNSNNWKTINEEEGARPLLKNEDGTFWVGNPFFIQRINLDGEVHQKIEAKHKGLSGTWSFFKDKNETLWSGGGDKLAYKYKDENEIHIYTKDDPTHFSNRRGAIQNMIPTKDGKVWFCSWTGLYLFDPIEEKILARFADDEKGDNYLPADIFYYLSEDKNGIYWLATKSGLIRWQPPSFITNNESSVTNHQLFTRNDGLSNNVIYAIFEDKHNRLWLSSDYGIMSFNKTTFDVKTYLEKDGITHHEFNRTSQFQTEDGTIYFGGLNGITSFHPDDFIEDKKDQPKVLISDYEIFDGKKGTLVNRVGELRNTQTIDFYPSDRFFRLKFVLPTFEDIDKILYAWKVEGVDEDWHYQKENALQFGALPYGTHTLHIKGQSSTGGWSPHELAMKVNVYKPFYLQAWFLLLTTLGLITGVFLFYKRRTSQLLRQQEVLETEIQKATQQIQNDKSTIEADKKTIELQAEELKELDKLKSRFFANVSHELRTPLTLMLGPISSAIKRGELSNRDFTLLKTAQQNGQDLLKLIAAILDLSKMESGKMELEETSELLFPLVRRIASNFESHAQRGGVQFNFNYKAEKDLQIEVDKSKLEIIINNLLSNAVKFTPSGGKITVLVEDITNKLKFSVADTGRGIHPDDLEFVFDRFYQSKQPNAPTEGGTGIGLALSQEFVKMMGGKIWVESQIGKGSTFTFEIPRKEILGMVTSDKILELEKLETELETLEVPVLEKQLVNQNGQSTILVVEDNHTLRQYLQTILSNQFNVLTAENGLVALDVLTNAFSKKEDIPMPNLIISDIMMPVMDGFQFLQTVKDRKYFSHLPMIMLTARADIKDKLKALRIGVDDYLLKPFEEEELLVRIHNLLKNYQERVLAVEEFSEENVEEEKAISEVPIISRQDQKWLDEVEKILQKELSNNQYSMNNLAFDLELSERQLRRRIKQFIGISPAQYLKEIRLHQAREFLQDKKYNTIAKTAAAVGFQDVRTFSRNYFTHFGKKPSEYLNG